MRGYCGLFFPGDRVRLDEDEGDVLTRKGRVVISGQGVSLFGPAVKAVVS